MLCDKNRLQIAKLVDGELSTEEKELLEKHIEQCESCRTELVKQKRLAKELEQMNVKQPHDESLDRYESHVFARMERGVAWILLSIGAVILGCAGLFYLVQDFFFSPEVPLAIRVGTGFAVAGSIVLAVATLRHRLATYKTDKYKGVVR